MAMDYTKGLERIWTEDEEIQRGVLEMILRDIRGLEDEPLKVLLDYMIKDQMFYVPNDFYMVELFGESILKYNNGIYFDGVCNLCYRLAMPIRLMDDTVVGFIGYTNKNDFDEDDSSFIKYRYPPKYVLPKNKYMYITRTEFKKAIEDGYICIVDGLFDQKVLVANGINAVSLCGSALTEYHKVYLECIKHKIIIADNDEAGRKMANDICRVWSNSVEIYQDKAKDIDGFLRKPERVKELKELIELMRLEGFTISHNMKSNKLERRDDLIGKRQVREKKEN